VCSDPDFSDALLPPGIEPGDLPDSSSNGAKLLSQYCTQCHEMPGPGMHTTEEWPRVVDRMNQRMQMMGGQSKMRIMHDIKASSDGELQILVTYLQNMQGDVVMNNAVLAALPENM